MVAGFVDSRYPMRSPPFIRNVLARLRTVSPVRWALILGIVASAWYLLAGRKPWETQWAERVAEDKTPRLADYIDVGMWGGAAFALAIFLVMLATSRWWLRAVEVPPLALGIPSTRPRPRWFWPALLLLLLAALVPRLMRMDHSLWGDEEWALRQDVHGQWNLVDEDERLGEIRFQPAGWDRTFFYSRHANNHILFSVFHRVFVDGWRAVTGAPREAFSEASTRVAPLIAGMASLGAIALFGRWLGFPGAGLLAAAFLALHPLHIRYSSEARGYSLLALAMVMVVWAGLGAVRNGRWRDWIWFVVAEFAAIYTWNAAVIPCLFLNLILLGAVIVLRRHQADSPERPPGQIAPQLWRWWATGSCLAVVLVIGYAPVVGQIQHAMDSYQALRGEPMGVVWLADSLGRLGAGMNYWMTMPNNPAQVSLQAIGADHGAALWTALIALPALCLWGAVSLARTRGMTVALITAAPVPALVVTWLEFHLMGIEFRYFYQFFAYPAFFFLIAVGLAAIGRVFAAKVSQRAAWVGALPAAVGLVAFALLVWPQIVSQTRYAFEDFRGAARHVGREGFAERSSEGTSVLTVDLWRSAPLYDPWADTHSRSPDELMERVEEARAKGLDMYVTVGFQGLTELLFPGTMEILMDSSLFTKVETYYAEERMCTLVVYHLNPAPAPEAGTPVQAP
ncbi:hypothetical protein BH23VER1_BH23VER1_20590 [soil metagenome]